MSPWLGRVVLGLSGMGFPISQLVVRRFGRPGAVVVEGVAVGLLVRDAAMIATGVPERLRPGPARLLYAETAAAAASVVLGLPLLMSAEARARATSPGWKGCELVRRIALGTLFGLHTMRFRIYLTPDRGLREVDVA